MVLFISPDGDHLVGGTPAFFEQIGYQDPDFDAEDYAVRNLGFIAITCAVGGRLNLRLRADLLTSDAIEAAFRFLAELASDEMEAELEHYDALAETWIVERCATRLIVQNHILLACSLPRVA